MQLIILFIVHYVRLPMLKILQEKWRKKELC
jgi:hypothetical protein